MFMPVLPLAVPAVAVSGRFVNGVRLRDERLTCAVAAQAAKQKAAKKKKDLIGVPK